MRLFHRFRKKRSRAYPPLSLRRRSTNDPNFHVDDDDDNDGIDQEGSPQVGEDAFVSSSPLLLLEMTDGDCDENKHSYYELPPPTSSSSSGGTKSNPRNTITDESKVLSNRYRESAVPINTAINRSSLPLLRPVELPSSFSPTNIGSRRRNKSISVKGIGKQNTPSSPLYATILDLPHLVQTLRSSSVVTSDAVSHTLRRLFALSEYTSATMKGTSTTSSSTEYESLEETRKQMVTDPSLLVPCLFYFLIRCYVEDNASSTVPQPRSIASDYLRQIRSSHMNRSSRGEWNKSNRTISHPVTMYLALLVLNNLCIPNDNKRYIAFQCHGVDIICHLLCYDPSCRMLAIVLVNLTFGTNAQFQHDLLFQNETNSDTELLSSLAYVLRVASLTRDEHDTRQRLFMKEAHEIFSWDSRHNTLAVDSTSREQQLNALLVFDQYGVCTKSWPTHSEQMYPDTARWCICALHHLTRPSLQYTSTDSHQYDTAHSVHHHQYKSSAAMALTRTNIVQHLLCCIRIGTIHDVIQRPNGSNPRFASALICHTSNDPQILSDNLITVFNDPSTWVKETSQDAALFVIMNISIDPNGRKYLLGHDIDTVHLLASIADSYHTCTGTSDTGFVATQAVPSTKHKDTDAIKIKQFQCVKARMALSYLVGSQGHYGQEKTRVGKWVKDYILDRQVLTMKDPFEAEHLIDMLAHSMYRRTKDGPGGYSGTTFRIKYVVWAIRSLLTQPDNQEMFAGNGMEVLNALLIKILALRAIQNATYIDSETAEHACFSLYLLSHYGFHICFLPSSLGKEYNVRHIVTKTLIAIQSMNDTTLVTHHAVRQILYRLRYLLCIDTAASISAMTRYTKWRYQRYHNNRIIDNDNSIFEQKLVTSVRNMLISDKVRSGAQPRPDIFNRPIISYRHVGNRDMNRSDGDDGVCDRSTISTYYSSAIHAAYDFSFQSTLTQHLNETTIDDIAIANSIANCADGKSSVESYGCAWTWDDDDDRSDHGDDIDNQAKHTAHGGHGGEGEGRQRLNHWRLANHNKKDHKVSSLWSSILFSPQNCCGGGGVPGTTHNDDMYNDKSFEEW